MKFFNKNKFFILYRENKPVAKIEYSLSNNNEDKISGRQVHITNSKKHELFIVEKVKVINENLMPEIYKTNKNMGEDSICTMMSHWLNAERSIPNGRVNIEKALKKLKIKSVPELLMISNGLSITDRYWYGNNTKSGYLWKELNFFEHSFSTDVGRFLTGEYFCEDTDKLNFHDPSITTNGRQDKMWLISNGKNVLAKQNTEIEGIGEIYESINEIIYAKVAEYLNIDFVHYEIGKLNGKNACFCESFIENGEEYISTSHFIKHNFSNEFTYLSFLKTASEIGINSSIANEFLSKLGALTCITLNADLNNGNVGFVVKKDENGNIVNARIAPVFDGGNSMGVYEFAQGKLGKETFETLKENLLVRSNIVGKTYYEISSKIGQFEDVNIEKLKDIPNFIKTICKGANIDNQLSNKLSELYSESISNFIKIVVKNRENKAEDIDKYIDSFDVNNETLSEKEEDIEH